MRSRPSRWWNAAKFIADRFNTDAYCVIGELPAAAVDATLCKSAVYDVTRAFVNRAFSFEIDRIPVI